MTQQRRPRRVTWTGDLAADLAQATTKKRYVLPADLMPRREGPLPGWPDSDDTMPHGPLDGLLAGVRTRWHL